MENRIGVMSKHIEMRILREDWNDPKLNGPTDTAVRLIYRNVAEKLGLPEQSIQKIDLGMYHFSEVDAEGYYTFEAHVGVYYDLLVANGDADTSFAVPYNKERGIYLRLRQVAYEESKRG